MKFLVDNPQPVEWIELKRKGKKKGKKAVKQCPFGARNLKKLVMALKSCFKFKLYNFEAIWTCMKGHTQTH